MDNNYIKAGVKKLTMTSKEALEHIINNDYNQIICTIPAQEAYNGLTKGEMAEIVEKDLEVLEIIKNHIAAKTIEYGNCFDTHNTISLVVEIIQLKDFTNELTGQYNMAVNLDNDFETIKEWLENDK